MSDIGRIRRRNEDSLALIPGLGVAIVADGMGGHPGGDVASRIAAETAARLLEEALVETASSGEHERRTLLRTAMEHSILNAHAEIRKEGAVRPALEGMGTTFTAMALDVETGAFVIGHVGDSRAYRLRAGELAQLTRDDTWIQQQIERGDVLPENAKRSPYAHLLTQCLGLEETPTPQVLDGGAEPGDAFLLCSDGLVGMLDDSSMESLLGAALEDDSAADAKVGTAAVRALLDAANVAGGHDNITAALIRFA